MGERVNGAVGLLVVAVVLGSGCAGRSQRVDGDEGRGAAGEDGAGGSEITGGTGGTAGSAGSGFGGTISTGGGVVTGGAAGAAGAGNASGAAGEGGAPPLGDPVWFMSGSLPLSRRAYQRTIAQLFGLPFDETLPRERLVLEPGIDPKLGAAELPQLSEIARETVTPMDDQALLEVVPCVDRTRECGEQVVDSFGPKAFRRPLDADEREAFIGVFESVVPEPELSPVKETLTAMLRSPNAQRLRAVGTANEQGEVTLDGFEIASLLSYWLTELPPDAQLRAAAEGRSLIGFERRHEEAERLFRSPDGVTRFREFIRDWFRIEDTESLWLYAEQPELAEAFELETNRFIETATYEDEEPVSVLLSAPWSVLSSELVEHYGITTMSASARVDLSETRRRGLLHHGSFLASRAQPTAASLIARSVATLTLLCEEIELPPVDVMPPGAEPGRTSRDTLTSATEEPVCFGCHSVLNPFAFAFGKFDQRGVFIEFEGDLAIDSTGTGDTFDGATFTFEDSADLAEQMANHPRFTECFHRNLIRAFAGVELFDPATSDYVRKVMNDGAVFSMVDAQVMWSGSPHFVRRTPCCELK